MITYINVPSKGIERKRFRKIKKRFLSRLKVKTTSTIYPINCESMNSRYTLELEK